ncbi:putative leader peptide [Amycolatopsis sp.]
MAPQAAGFTSRRHVDLRRQAGAMCRVMLVPD